MHTNYNHRRSHGAIDIDAYRAEALRRQEMTRRLRHTGRVRWPVIGIVAIIVAGVVLLPHNRVSPETNSVSLQAKSSLLSN